MYSDRRQCTGFMVNQEHALSREQSSKVPVDTVHFLVLNLGTTTPTTSTCTTTCPKNASTQRAKMVRLLNVHGKLPLQLVLKTAQLKRRPHGTESIVQAHVSRMSDETQKLCAARSSRQWSYP
mmetsp:Transcript_12879/g.30235  ORF Transcript_12879/g.30235 Transcript_12879/m.30235 type:complete len:123 (-) Transcript_12879:561-929(-)